MKKNKNRDDNLGTLIVHPAWTLLRWLVWITIVIEGLNLAYLVAIGLQIVEYYKTFPLGLKIVAGSLCNQPFECWKSKLNECSNASFKLSTKSTDNDLVACLHSQLENLDAAVKECFMDLGSFPEDKRIPVATLIDIWTELYYLSEDADAIAKLVNLTTWNFTSLIVTRYVDSFICQISKFLIFYLVSIYFSLCLMTKFSCVRCKLKLFCRLGIIAASLSEMQ